MEHNDIGHRTTSKNGLRAPPGAGDRISRTTKRRHPAARRPVEREVHCMARCPVETWLLDCGCAHSRTLASIIPTSSPLPPRSWNAKSEGCAVVLATRPCPQGVLPRSARWIMRGARPLGERAGRSQYSTSHAFQPSSLSFRSPFGPVAASSHGYTH